MPTKKWIGLLLIIFVCGCAEKTPTHVNKEDLFRLLKRKLQTVENIVPYSSDPELAKVEILKGGTATKVSIQNLEVEIVECSSIEKAMQVEKRESKNKDHLFSKQIQIYHRNRNMLLLFWGYDLESKSAQHILEIFNSLTPETFVKY